jgi:sugar O-acyltransferase (sialic acid O-acetyltransferase NeuD family)
MRTVIFGAGPQGRVVLEVLRAQGNRDILGFLDDNASKHGMRLAGLAVLGGSAWAATETDRGLAAIVAIGGNDPRVAIAQKLRGLGVTLINAIHPTAVVQGATTLGTGNLICAGAIVVTGTRIADDVVINTRASIDHDCVLQTGAQVAPGVVMSGCVTIGSRAFIGVGAVVGPSVTIGERAIVGAGSVVLADVPAGVLAYGVPCRVVRELVEPVDWGAILGGAPSPLACRTATEEIGVL